jgi:N6-L-threonylcarbamoyladenine synthase
MELIGSTLDDAAGEAFDKTGKLLGLDYPAGPLIDFYAKQGEPRFEFPEPKIQGLNFSFSGLKTAILYFLKDNLKEDPEFIQKNMNDICASVQERIVSILLSKLKRASRETGIKEIAIAGGVSANSALRSQLKSLEEKLGWNTFIPEFEFCTDNAAMIGITGYYKYLKEEFSDQKVTPLARWAV